MNKDEMHVVADLNARRRALNYTFERLAEKIGKDPSTVQRQLNQTRGQCTAFTIYEYAEALGCTVQLVTDDDWEVYSHAHEIKTLCEAFRVENEDLRKQIENLSAQVENMKLQVAEYKDNSDSKDKRIEQLYDAVDRKDKMIASLLKRVADI